MEGVGDRNTGDAAPAPAHKYVSTPYFSLGFKVASNMNMLAQLPAIASGATFRQ
jgi:hypothetical protein